MIGTKNMQCYFEFGFSACICGVLVLHIHILAYSTPCCCHAEQLSPLHAYDGTGAFVLLFVSSPFRIDRHSIILLGQMSRSLSAQIDLFTV